MIAKNRRTILIVIFLSCFFKLSSTVTQAAPDKNKGYDPYQNTGFNKYLKNFNRTECQGLWVNRAILQDKRGVMYFGGEGGLREFDGVTWRPIPVPNDWVSALAVDERGIIYVGGNNDIGYLTPDSRGSLQYQSLVQLLEKNQRSFSVLRIHAINDDVYFVTGKYLIQWNRQAGKIKVWEPAVNSLDQGFDFSCKYEGTLLVQEINAGLKQMINGALQSVPGCEKAAAERICMLVPYSPGKKLLGTRSSKLYIHDGQKLVPFPIETPGYLEQSRLIQGIRLKNGDFALATLFGGIVVIAPSGGIKEIYSEATGLPDDLVNYVFEDTQGNLWLAQEAGIAKIENVFPISTHSDPSQYIYSIVKHRSLLYVGTRSGLFYLTPGGDFQQVPGIPVNCYDFLSIGDSLFVANYNGLFLLGEKGASKLLDAKYSSLLHSRVDQNRIWAQTFYALFSFYRQNGRWEKEFEIEKENQLIHSIVEDKKGNLWLGTINKGDEVPMKGVMKVIFPGKGSTAKPQVYRFDMSFGLQSNVNHVFWAADHVIFSSGKGIFRFDEEKNVFVPDLLLGKNLASLFKKRSVRNLVEDKHKNIWISFYDGTLLQAIKQPDGTFLLNEKPFLRIPPHVEILGIYPDPEEDITWLYSRYDLIRFDTKVKMDYRRHFNTLIRRVQANGTIIYNGYGSDKEGNVSSSRFSPRVSYKDRSLSFEFAAPFFEGESAAQYRYQLEGHDRHWSDWTSDTSVEYAALKPGNYRFRLQAQNVYRYLGSEAVFTFKILLPWYRSWWAILFYVLVLSMMFYMVTKWRRALQLEQEKQRLENIVQERIKEIDLKNRQLEKQTLQLREQSEKLQEMDKVKSRFFANISHEFRTPLSLIMGPLEQMRSLEKYNQKDWHKNLTLMLRNSQRLLRLIDQLLELSKLESGNVRLKVSSQDIVLFLKGIAASFEPVISGNELDLSVQAAKEKIILYFDPEKMEEIIFNLLSNAAKFTPPGGKIVVTVSEDTREDGAFQEGTLLISVCDTGPGIPREQLNHIFDRFFQSDSTYEYHKKGSGIGLAIAKELVELHHGRIEALDKEGKGAEFIIRLPMGNSHLKPGEVNESPGEPYRYKHSGESPDHRVGDTHVDAPPPQDSIEPGAPGKEIILLVEDSADFREYMKGALELFYAVETAKDGEEGIKKALEIIPDLIISDIMMPGVDGYSLCRELKNHRLTSHIPIILLTARASEESIVAGLSSGADEYITKPFNTKILCARIKNLIEQRRRLHLKRRQLMMVNPPELELSSVDEVFFKELGNVIEKNLANSDFNVEQLKNKFCMGRTTLYRKIMGLTGLSPNKFIRKYRLQRAAQLLKANTGNVSEVAVAVGFTNMAYFSQCFKEEFQQSPSSFLAFETKSRALYRIKKA